MKKGAAQKREEEKQLVSQMIALYCRGQHGSPRGTLCQSCRKLEKYALQRIENCPFMETKTFCSACQVHCYEPEMRQRIRTVMRWAGPRLLFVRPIPALRHAFVTLRAKRTSREHHNAL